MPSQTMILAAFLVTSQAVFLNANHGALYSDKWVQAATKFDHYVHPFKHQFIKQLDEISISHEIRISPDCREGLQNFSSGLKHGRLRETMMFDSYSTILPGMISSLGYDMGSYQQCLKYGRYVYLGVEFPVPKDPSVKEFAPDPLGNDNWMMFYSRSMGFRRIDGFHFGICSPDACKEKDLRQIFESRAVQKRITPLWIRIHSTESRSEAAESLSQALTPTWRQRIAWTALWLILLLGIGSGISNLMSPESAMSQNLKPFDAFSNTMHLFSAKTKESMFTNVNGYRWMYLVMSVWAHTWIGANVRSQMVRTETAVGASEKTPFLMMLFMDTIFINFPAILTFNLILSACFTTFKSVEIMRKTKVNFSLYLVERMLRLSPVMAVYILFTQSFPLIHFAGPLMQRVQQQSSDLCYQNGWKDLLFINNYDITKDLCIPFAWFMSVDFQIYFFAFPVLLLMAKYPQHAYKLIQGVIVLGIGASGWRFIRHPYPPIIPSKVRTAYDAVTYFLPEYYHTLHHIPVYGVGMLLGYKMLLLNGKQTPVTVRRFFGKWGCLCLGTLFIICCAGKFLSLSELVHAALVRTIAGSFFAFLFYVFFNMDSVWLRAVAKSRFIVIASRLSLTWYLTHCFHIMYVVAAQPIIQMNVLLVVMDGLFVLMTSFFSACMLHVFVEAPIGRLTSRMKKQMKHA